MRSVIRATLKQSTLLILRPISILPIQPLRLLNASTFYSGNKFSFGSDKSAKIHENA